MRYTNHGDGRFTAVISSVQSEPRRRCLLSRRSAVSGLTWVLLLLVLEPALVGAATNNFTQGREVAPLSPKIKAGDYVWKPDVSPTGPVVLIVSIPQQTLFVYRNGVRIGR